MRDKAMTEGQAAVLASSSRGCILAKVGTGATGRCKGRTMERQHCGPSRAGHDLPVDDECGRQTQKGCWLGQSGAES